MVPDKRVFPSLIALTMHVYEFSTMSTLLRMTLRLFLRVYLVIRVTTLTKVSA